MPKSPKLFTFNIRMTFDTDHESFQNEMITVLRSIE